jgi:hypothetical protein
MCITGKRLRAAGQGLCETMWSILLIRKACLWIKTTEIFCTTSLTVTFPHIHKQFVEKSGQKGSIQKLLLS